MQLNLMATSTYFDKALCSQCEHYRIEEDESGSRHVVDSFCCNCYSDRVYILTRFKKRDKDNPSDQE